MLANTGWLLIDKLVAVTAGLLVGLWVARYLGPAQYGTLNYAIAFVTLFMPFSELGLRDIVIRRIVGKQGARGQVLGSAFLIQLISAGVAVCLVIGLAWTYHPEDQLMRLLIAILSGQTLFMAWINTVEAWFHSQVQAKYAVWAKNLSLATIAGVKILLILSHAPLVAFAWAALAETGLFALTLMVSYRLSGGWVTVWRLDFTLGRRLLKESWPLALSAMAITLHMKIDQVMLCTMVSEEALGLYSAALRVSEVFYVVPMAIGSSFFPLLLRARDTLTQEAYSQQTETFFLIMAASAYAILVPVALLAPRIIAILFGIQYTGAGPILRVHIWVLLFLSLGIAGSRWLMAEGMMRLTMLATFCGLGANVALNWWLIPRYSGLGAAWATLGSQAVSSLLFFAFVPRLWPLLGRLAFSLLVPLRIKRLIAGLRSLR